jgi:hypothetical protein
MATVRYTKTYFNEPGRINEETFNSLKRELTRNPNFVIDPSLETFSQHFKGVLTAIKIAGGYFVLYLIIFGSKSDHDVPGVFNLLAGLSMLTIVFSGFNLLLEGRSYATYVKERKSYFDRMSYAISISNNYYEYIENFYGKK